MYRVVLPSYSLTHTQARDVKAILRKFMHVLMPVGSNKTLLHDCEVYTQGLVHVVSVNTPPPLPLSQGIYGDHSVSV